MRIDREQLHRLYLEGKTTGEIAEIIGSTNKSVRTMIMNERKKYPYAWPFRNRADALAAPLPLMMHLYECEDCCITFSVEDYEGVDHSFTVCPICHNDESLRDVGYGQFVDSNPVRKSS